MTKIGEKRRLLHYVTLTACVVVSSSLTIPQSFEILFTFLSRREQMGGKRYIIPLHSFHASFLFYLFAKLLNECRVENIKLLTEKDVKEERGKRKMSKVHDVYCFPQKDGANS